MKKVFRVHMHTQLTTKGGSLYLWKSYLRSHVIPLSCITWVDKMATVLIWTKTWWFVEKNPEGLLCVVYCYYIAVQHFVQLTHCTLQELRLHPALENVVLRVMHHQNLHEAPVWVFAMPCQYWKGTRNPEKTVDSKVSIHHHGFIRSCLLCVWCTVHMVHSRQTTFTQQARGGTGNVVHACG